MFGFNTVRNLLHTPFITNVSKRAADVLTNAGFFTLKPALSYFILPALDEIFIIPAGSTPSPNTEHSRKYGGLYDMARAIAAVILTFDTRPQEVSPFHPTLSTKHPSISRRAVIHIKDYFESDVFPVLSEALILFVYCVAFPVLAGIFELFKPYIQILVSTFDHGGTPEEHRRPGVGVINSTRNVVKDKPVTHVRKPRCVAMTSKIPKSTQKIEKKPSTPYIRQQLPETIYPTTAPKTLNYTNRFGYVHTPRTPSYTRPNEKIFTKPTYIPKHVLRPTAQPFVPRMAMASISSTVMIGPSFCTPHPPPKPLQVVSSASQRRRTSYLNQNRRCSIDGLGIEGSGNLISL